MRLIDSLGSRVVRLIGSRWPICSDRQQRAVFIVGCQRSGTTMLVNVFGKSRHCRVYNEGKNNAAFDYYRLRVTDTLRYLILRSREPIVVFKPVLDSQQTDRLLDLFPNARALWIYRDYRDVVNSSVKKWQGDQKDIMYGIAAGIQRDPKHHQYAIRDRMTARTVDLVKRLCSPDMSAEDGAALLWYVRNLILFDLKLAEDDRVLLVRYEDLVAHPNEHLARIFAFIGCPFGRNYTSDIFATSVHKNRPPDIDKEIEQLCREMAQRLNGQYSKQLSRSMPSVLPKEAESAI